MKLSKFSAPVPLSAMALAVLSLFHPLVAPAATSTPVSRAFERAQDLGRINTNKELNLTVVLQMHDQPGYDKAVEALYDADSATYHKWFTAADFARYAPTPAEFEMVKRELVKHGFSVVSESPNRLSMRVHGNVGNAESAFQTEIHALQYKGKTFDAPRTEPRLTGMAGALVKGVSGLERHAVAPALTVAKNPRTGVAVPKQVLSKLTKTNVDPLSLITGVPLSPAAEYSYEGYLGELPHAFYYGYGYDTNPNLTVAYTPQQLQTHYGLTGLIGEGYDGTGQTIALVEGYGNPNAFDDANTAAAIFGLPLFDSTNFSTIYPEGPPVLSNAADETGWTIEIALDIQSAHSIAPGAKILVVASAGQDNEDQIASLEYIIDNKLASVASGSWENDDEVVAGPYEVLAFNAVLEQGAASGISFQFSTGDSGDLGLGSPVGALGIPSDSPYATAVGGTSILNDPRFGGQQVAGWGNNLSYIALGGPADPPFELGFLGGSGGGESVYLLKPSWQKNLPGIGRQAPDVSALADPYTGFAIVYTFDGVQYFSPGWGGTSLASPIFTAIWAIADEYNGSSLGLASIPVSKLKPWQITDVLPNTPLNWGDAHGTIYDSSGATSYGPDNLFYGLYSQTQFPEAVWPFDSEDAAVLSFGTDTSLTVTPGWDNVTGYGEPNGLPFIQGVTGKTTGAPVPW